MDGFFEKQEDTLLPVSLQIWNEKYRAKGHGGLPLDNSIDDTHLRVARALASVETDPVHWTNQFFWAMQDFKFLPAGRIVSASGMDLRVTMFNCFVMGNIPDDLGGIFDHLKEAALTMQQGGGIGYDFSSLRPKGAWVKGVGADASGTLSFMDVWDGMCRTIMSAGSRRGAMMAAMLCDHPDIEAFIEAKREAGRLRMFNMSVLVTDAFMTAVRNDGSWTLKFDGVDYKTLQARDLWDKIMRATYSYAEPGVIFIDRINRRNNLWYCENIHATNPCGEQPLPPYGVCLLGSINLARLVKNPFEDNASLDGELLSRLVSVCTRMLDNVIDVSKYPLLQHEQEAKSKRRIGMGITGLADALIMCGVKYGSPESVALSEQWLASIRRQAYLTSTALAEEKGVFPLYDGDKFLEGENVLTLDDDVRSAIAKHGIRNALLTSIAPAGTISLFADNVSSGLEPVFSLKYDRKILNQDGTSRIEEVSNYAYRLFRRLKGDSAPLPASFVTAEGLKPIDHLTILAGVQKQIDASISKTINLPEDIAFEDFKTVYMDAYDMGCKGCTTYRPNDVTGSILSTSETKAPVKGAEVPAPSPVKPMARPEELPGATYKLAYPSSDHAMYITINDVVENGQRRPFEIFINSKNMECYSWTVALTRMVSAVFRRGGDISFVVEELQSVFDPRGGQWMGRRYVPSILAAIGDILQQHLRSIGYLKDDPSVMPETTKIEEQPASAKVFGKTCPKCSQPTLVKKESCDSCMSCGYSKCSG